MSRNFGVLQFFLILGLAERVFLVPATTSSRSTSSSSSPIQEQESRLVEIKLPVRITSIDDLIEWARNAMRSMASRIDITLATVEDEPVAGNHENIKPSSNSEKRLKQREPVVPSSATNKRPIHSAGALVQTYASLFGAENSYGTISQDQNNLIADILPNLDNSNIRDVMTRRDNDLIGTILPHANVNAYLPLLLDNSEISNFREEALKKYYRDSEEAKLEKKKKEIRDNAAVKYFQAIGQQTSRVSVKNENQAKTSLTKNFNDEKISTPVISVPFEAIVKITRENLPEPTTSSFTETRDPPDEFPPYFERDYPRPEVSTSNDSVRTKKTKENSQKRQIATIGDFLRMLGITRKLSSKKINSSKSSQSARPKKPSEKFTPPEKFTSSVKFEFEDQPQRQRRNETSQRQELDEEDEEDEEDEGSLGSISDFLPLVLPILEDISDPNTETDLGEVLAAAIPLVQGLSDPDDPEAADILGMIGPILTNILGGKDGEGSDVAAVLGPLITLIAPLIGPVLGPLVGPLLTASSNPPQGEGSSLATLINAVVGPLVQPTEPGGMSPLTVLTAGVIAALSKELKPGVPGGLDVGALVGAILSGVIAGASGGLSGTLSGNNGEQQNYVPYGPAGPLQAGSVNTRTSAGFQAPGSQQQGPFQAPGNFAERPKIVYHTTRRPYSTLPQRIPSGSPARPQSTNYVHFPPTGPLQAGTTNGGNDGGSSYLPYGTNSVPAKDVNPIGLIGSAIKDVLGAGIQVVSSVINAVFGIIGGSSSSDDEPAPVYGPPQGPYGHGPR